MKQFSDQTEALVLNPTVINPKTVNEYNDTAILSTDELAIGNNIILDDKIIEKVPGTYKENSDTVNSPVTGLHRSYGLGTEKVWLRLANGILKSGPAAFATTVLSGLSTSKITPFINVKGKAYGINETDGIIRYDPKITTGVLTGIINPFLRKKIAFFESDETWTGGSANTGTYRGEEWTGNAVTSRQITASVSGNTASYSNITVDLSQFANSKASDDNDYICFHTFHNTRANIDYITVEFSTGGTGFTTKYMTTLYQSSFTVGDHEWTEWKVRKGAFSTTGTPSWAGTQSVRFTVYANANGAVTIDFDFCYLKASPPRAYELKRQIFTCENNTDETWSDNAELTSVKVYDGYRAVRVAGTAGGAARTATLALGTQVDLSKWQNNVSSPTTDEIVFRIQTNDTAALNDTTPLTLRIGESSTVYWSYAWASKDVLGLIGNNQWFEVRVKKSSFSATGGITLWSAIDYVQFITSALTGTTKYLYFDDMKMEQMNPSLTIADFESDETWTITGNGEMSTDKNGVTEGSQCLRLWAATPLKISQSSAVNDTATINLTAFSDSSTSDTSDYISFSLRHQYIANIEYLEIWFDANNLATFAIAYKYRVDKSAFGGGGVKNNQSTEIRIKKSDFETIGTGGAWSTIGAIKFILSSKGQKTTGSVFIDNLVMKRKTGLTGRYYYKYTFCIGDVISATSESSDYVDVKGSFILLDNIKTSQDSRVNKRQIYRLGGDFPDTWMLVKTIDDNTTTTLVDDVDDEDLALSMGNDVPQGNISSVLGNNLIYDSENDTVYYWGDPTYKNRVYYSHSSYYHVVDETAYRTFPDDVMCVVSWFGQNVIFYKNKIQKIVGSIPTGDLIDLPINVGACSYWAALKRPYQGTIPFAGWDNVYVFDGYKAIPIGDDVKSHFKGNEGYLSNVSIAENKNSLYISHAGFKSSAHTEVIIGGTFDTDLTGWNDKDGGTGISDWSSGMMRLRGLSEGEGAREQTVTTIADNTYPFEFDIITNPVTLTIGTNSGGTDIHNQSYSPGLNQAVSFIAENPATGIGVTTVYIRFTNGENNTAYVDNVSLWTLSTVNDTVIRCYLPTKSWTVLPDWDVNVWAHSDEKDDSNDLLYGDSGNGNIFRINYTTYLFSSSAIGSTIKSGWLNVPEHELALKKIEFKAKGTAASTLTFSGFKNHSAAPSCTASITLTASWVTYQLGSYNLQSVMRGDALAYQFEHSTSSAYFKMKDIVLHIEKIPKRITLNEKAVTLT